MVHLIAGLFFTLLLVALARLLESLVRGGWRPIAAALAGPEAELRTGSPRRVADASPWRSSLC